MRISVAIGVGLLALVAVYGDNQRDPYAVLGVSRKASSKDIKSAYKRLAMEWHPDKNSSPEASERFMEINQAYEVLTDPTRKERFDRYGSFDEPQQRRGHHYHHPDFDSFFNFAFGGFDRGGDGGKPSFFETHRITMRMYAHSILEKTHTQPFLIFAYSSYCHGCFMLEPVWKEAVTDLEALDTDLWNLF
ncbi:DnaJ domain containing protein [Aphelenchoides avenae]|nr:DnaJ domain containing protein [Aphelenchus avenae]